ncbi:MULTISPECIES: pyruvate kinase [Chromohalobacter]|jgi:pyruvate kinase|uniref:Pyruvate kinase n=1 Tax=Chromohalobacter israelensis (strain ATCC BAA-138 / DSM 3043 / CIP 106854 / NCIMB 13768 / 1H11) TaxID=290398 RepID=Q1QX96_CHRI1|nr:MULTISPECIES: pyruvate kinase [Chromohalobacter]ABE58912.1 pyruvate kinase [Chromohalobacter salexigens DSM 3043]MDO0944994.1 pyruvate kinase [Chromohalobacter salexigens]NQY44481.1 pyruvate kinase [Chromohalobacter sp.]NWO54662.1 pyruvate kinase [Chromohalobacter salexigens]RXE48026.1 pyruvate kinase [Chromohalobacter salexigens]
MQNAFHGPIRRTKIVATLGPASDREGVLDAMIAAGVDVVRLNFSHGSADDHRRRLLAVREAAERAGRTVAALGDLQGPKIRIARFQEGAVTLEQGQPFIIDVSLERDAGDANRVGCDYKDLADDVAPGDVLLLDDGRLELQVERVDAPAIHTTVKVGGKLSNNKGINKQGGGLSAAALTDKDREDLQTAIDIGVDYLAVSFPRHGDDMRLARDLLGEAGSHIGLVAKIERAEAVADNDTLDDIIRASEAVMVARGDLGVEIGDAQLIGVQKRIIQHARSLNKVVITATQMMESMIDSPLPTRAEVFDVANAVLDGTDAVMLSAETAAGDYPVETIKAMERLCLGAERERAAQQSQHRIHEGFTRVDETVALSAMYAANHLAGVSAIVCMTATGYTPLIASRIRSGLPIVALAHTAIAQRRMALYRGVVSLPFDTQGMPPTAFNRHAVDRLVSLGIAKQGDHVILTRGDHMNAHGGTNTMKIIQVGDDID